MHRVRLAILLFVILPAALMAQDVVDRGRAVGPEGTGAKPMEVTPLLLAAQQKLPIAMSDKAHPPQLSGTVVDSSGAVIAGATVQARSANGTVPATAQSNPNGSFTISGLSAGDYRLVVSNPGFEPKEIPVTITLLPVT